MHQLIKIKIFIISLATATTTEARQKLIMAAKTVHEPNGIYQFNIK
jgi:hypothetical protein